MQKCYEILETLGDKTKQLSIDEINRLKEQFWHILESEISKINVGYTEREELCCKRFRMFDFRTFIISHHTVRTTQTLGGRPFSARCCSVNLSPFSLSMSTDCFIQYEWSNTFCLVIHRTMHSKICRFAAYFKKHCAKFTVTLKRHRCHL